MTKIDKLAADFCAASVARADLSSAALRLGTWLLGASKITGEFPIELSLAEMTQGIERNGVKLPGTGAHRITLNLAIDQLEACGYLEREPVRTLRGGGTGYAYAIRVPRL